MFELPSPAPGAVFKPLRDSRQHHAGARSRKVSGGYSEGETPLPIPNREVKPLSADGTWPARAWESRSPPVLTLRSRPVGRLFSCSSCGEGSGSRGGERARWRGAGSGPSAEPLSQARRAMRTMAYSGDLGARDLPLRRGRVASARQRAVSYVNSGPPPPFLRTADLSTVWGGTGAVVGSVGAEKRLDQAVCGTRALGRPGCARWRRKGDRSGRRGQ